MRPLALVVALGCTNFVQPEPCSGPTVITIYENGDHIVERPCREPCKVNWGAGYFNPELAVILCGLR